MKIEYCICALSGNGVFFTLGDGTKGVSNNLTRNPKTLEPISSIEEAELIIKTYLNKGKYRIDKIYVVE